MTEANLKEICAFLSHPNPQVRHQVRFFFRNSVRLKSNYESLPLPFSLPRFFFLSSRLRVWWPVYLLVD
jgi:hypothetical protein